MTLEIEARWSREGDAIAKFWLWSDAQAFAEARSKEWPNDEYWLVGPVRGATSVSKYVAGVRQPVEEESAA